MCVLIVLKAWLVLDVLSTGLDLHRQERRMLVVVLIDCTPQQALYWPISCKNVGSLCKCTLRNFLHARVCVCHTCQVSELRDHPES